MSDTEHDEKRRADGSTDDLQPSAAQPPADESAVAAPDGEQEEPQEPSDASPTASLVSDVPGAGGGSAAIKNEGSESAARKAGAQGEGRDDKDRTFWFWVAGIVLILGIELYVFGHNGEIEVCVGVEGVTDWAQKDQPRTAENFRKAPVCAQRVNLGMYPGTQEAAEAALNDACKRATMMQTGALQHCIRREKQWTRRVEKQQVPPWDPRLYRRLLWLD